MHLSHVTVPEYHTGHCASFVHSNSNGMSASGGGVSVQVRTVILQNDTSKRMPNVGSGQYSPEVHWRKQKLWPEMHSCRKASLVFFRLPFDVGL